jgi:hypothetical protein
LILVATLEFITPGILAPLVRVQEDRAAELLESLREDLLTDRVWLPETATCGACWAYSLTRRGARLVSQLTKEDARRPTTDEKSLVLVNHRIALSQAAAGIMACLGPYRLEAVYLGRRLQSLLAESRLKGWYFPDAYIAFFIDTPQGRVMRHLFIEVDRGTESLRQLIRKFHALNSYHVQDHRRLFHSDRLVVAITVPTTLRLRRVCEAAREAKSRVRIFANLHARARAETGALEAWIDCLTGQGRSLLDIPQDAARGGSE